MTRDLGSRIYKDLWVGSVTLLQVGERDVSSKGKKEDTSQGEVLMFSCLLSLPGILFCLLLTLSAPKRGLFFCLAIFYWQLVTNSSVSTMHSPQITPAPENSHLL